MSDASEDAARLARRADDVHADLQADAQSDVVALHVAGLWVNQNGSQLFLDPAADGVLGGWFESQKGRAARGLRYSIVGRCNGALASFVVDFRSEQVNLGSITSFSGRWEREPDGSEVLHTLWVLARGFEDAERTRPTQAWNSFLVNSDVFRRPEELRGATAAREASE
jgi:hypothetical protein